MSDVFPPPVPAGPTPRLCSAPQCSAPAVLQWQRQATAAELAAITLPPGQTDATVAVFGCDQHALPLDPAAYLHLASCPWPTPCTCVAVTG